MTGVDRNLRNVWTIPTAPYPGSHYAVMPPALAAPCIRAGCPRGGIVLDPFMGSGTVARVAQENGRRWIGFDLDSRNAALVQGRTGVVHVGAEDALRLPEPDALPGQGCLWG